jgi:hypothetical protein
VVGTLCHKVLDVEANCPAESYTKSPDGHGDGGFGSLAQVVVLVELIVLFAKVPEPLCFPVHVMGPAVVFAFDDALADAVPRSESPGFANFTVPGPPVHVVVVLAAEALPLIATCATPTEMTGTVLRATTAMNLRNNYSTPYFLSLEADGRPHPFLSDRMRLARAALFAAASIPHPSPDCLRWFIESRSRGEAGLYPRCACGLGPR